MNIMIDNTFNKFILFTISGLIITVFLIGAYFSKKRVDTSITRNYVFMLFLALIVMVTEILFILILPLLHVPKIIIVIFAKIYLIVLQLFISRIAVYTALICNMYSKKKIFSDVAHKLFKYWPIVSGIIIMFSNIEITYNSDLSQVLYLYGKAPLMSIYFCMSHVFASIYYTIKGQKYIKVRKILPIYFYLFVAVIAGFMYFFNRYYIFVSFGTSIIIFVMYLTIQNPDLELVENLNISKEFADRANAAKSNFLSNMSHEIRTPLNAIVGLSKDIEDQEDLPEEVREDVHDIVLASKTLLEIINNILDINKLESGKMDVKAEPYNLVEEVKNIVEKLRPLVQPGVTLNLNYAGDIPYTLLGDKNHLKTIILNLLTNSIKYTSEGHINLNIKCINNFINEETTLIISVEDTGEGIRAEDIEKLFVKFQKLDVKRENTGVGAGLGLAITKKLVELMGGNINVQSQFGIGSIFVVQISQKIVSTVSQVEDDSVIDENIDFSSKRILVVDDNKLNLKVARRTLESLNIIIEECTSGQDCINKIRLGNSYDVILMDMMMPNLTGADTLAILLKTEGFTTPVIVLTADDSSDACDKYLSQGFTDYLSKPFSKEQIKLKLTKIFNSRKDR